MEAASSNCRPVDGQRLCLGPPTRSKLIAVSRRNLFSSQCHHHHHRRHQPRHCRPPRGTVEPKVGGSRRALCVWNLGPQSVSHLLPGQPPDGPAGGGKVDSLSRPVQLLICIGRASRRRPNRWPVASSRPGQKQSRAERERESWENIYPARARIVSQQAPSDVAGRWQRLGAAQTQSVWPEVREATC